MKQIIVIGMLVLILAISIIIVSISESEAKKYTVYVKAHLEKICPQDLLYFRMADNTRDPGTGKHSGLIWKTSYFKESKSDYNYKVNVDSKQVPSGRIVTYDEVKRNGEEIHDEYIHKTLVNGLKFSFNIPVLC